MLYQVEEAVHEASRARVLGGRLPHCVAFQFCQTHPSFAEIWLVLTGLSQIVALSFQMYSLSKDIYDKRVVFSSLGLLSGYSYLVNT